MTRETLEELRERLLRQHQVQRMIQVRAYEIYRMRGGQPGGEAQDWFHAENEVLAFLLADDSAREDDQTESAATSTIAPQAAEAPDTKKPRSRASGKSTAVTKKAASKPAKPKKSAESKSKSKRTSRTSKTEGIER